MKAEGIVGPLTSKAGEGAEREIALGYYGQLLESAYLPKFSELVGRGNVFSVGTAVAGVAPGTAISTTPPFALHNPSSSGKKLILLRARVQYISGTLGAGTAFLQQNAQTTAPSGGTALTAIVNAQLGNLASAAVAKAYQGSTVAATPTIVAPLFTVLAAGYVVPGIADLDGEYEVLPGTAISIQETGAAGTSPIVAFGVTWAEVAV